MDQQHHEPTAAPSPSTLPTIRHDGWTGEKMAAFCEALAETAVVAEACDQARMGISGAYALRRRNPVFAAAWDAALTIARERLADTLLARSMEGNVEQIYRDGELVGERHVLDNRLGLAILRRLDRLAETGQSLHSNPPQRSAPAILPRTQNFEWEEMVGALRSDDPDGVARALALIESHKVEEVEDPLNRPPSCHLPEEDQGIDLSGRCWKQDEMGDMLWMTDFPPPADFDGFEKGEFGDLDYHRECTPEEAELLDANEAAADAEEREAEEVLRDAWFEMLRSELPDADRAGLAADK